MLTTGIITALVPMVCEDGFHLFSSVEDVFFLCTADSLMLMTFLLTGLLHQLALICSSLNLSPTIGLHFHVESKTLSSTVQKKSSLETISYSYSSFPSQLRHLRPLSVSTSPLTQLANLRSLLLSHPPVPLFGPPISVVAK